MNNKLLRPNEVAERLNVSKPQVFSMLHNCEFSTHIKKIKLSYSAFELINLLISLLWTVQENKYYIL